MKKGKKAGMCKREKARLKINKYNCEKKGLIKNFPKCNMRVNHLDETKKKTHIKNARKFFLLPTTLN